MLVPSRSSSRSTRRFECATVGARRWRPTRLSPLGILGLVASGYPRLRTFILTLAVFDDLIALVVIATAYSEHVSFVALGLAIAFFATLLISRAAGVNSVPLAITLSVATWVALHESGIHPDCRRARRSD